MAGDGVAEASGVASWLNAPVAKSATLARQPSKIDFMRAPVARTVCGVTWFAAFYSYCDCPARFGSMFAFFSNRLGCVGSIVVSVIGTILLLALMRGCSGGVGW